MVCPTYSHIFVPRQHSHPTSPPFSILSFHLISQPPDTCTYHSSVNLCSMMRPFLVYTATTWCLMLLRNYGLDFLSQETCLAGLWLAGEIRSLGSPSHGGTGSVSMCYKYRDDYCLELPDPELPANRFFGSMLAADDYDLFTCGNRFAGAYNKWYRGSVYGVIGVVMDRGLVIGDPLQKDKVTLKRTDIYSGNYWKLLCHLNYSSV